MKQSSLIVRVALLLVLINIPPACTFTPLSPITTDRSMTTQGGTTSLPCRSGPTEERPNDPIWCPIQQIYVGGVLPENAKVQEMITANRGYLRIFGYGSLCWNPGTGALAHPTIQRTLGRAMGYRRCWAQKSTDHRGVPRFPGIVCTLLRDEEVRQLRDGDSSLLLVPCQGEGEESVTTEGVLYRVPPDLVEECLRELDFREKGVGAFHSVNGGGVEDLVSWILTAVCRLFSLSMYIHCFFVRFNISAVQPISTNHAGFGILSSISTSPLFKTGICAGCY